MRHAQSVRSEHLLRHVDDDGVDADGGSNRVGEGQLIVESISRRAKYDPNEHAVCAQCATCNHAYKSASIASDWRLSGAKVRKCAGR